MKNPKQLRDDVRALTSHLTQVREVLIKHSDNEIAQIGKECKRTADAIGELLKSQNLPNDYKVAVVGRFKTGKSSFVNELLGAKLANEDTNPETAAITTFKHGAKVVAIVSFTAQEEWSKLKDLYAEDPKHVDAHRVKMWESFGKSKKSKDGTVEEAVDLMSLELQYVKPGGYKLEIALLADGTKRSETEFRRKLKEFTSGAKPHHCLVQAIEITSPAAILDEGVLLIDTPGLDDTERFRVSLTEKTVEDVDAVLFLTQSGEGYAQSEKDFLLSLLRKGTVKQLIIVITQVDITYAKHIRNADANDEEPESLAERIAVERVRISREVAATLNDLSQDDSPAMRRYREQLGNVEIAFTSAVLHRDWKANKPLSCSIDAGDPGGVEKLKNQLLRLLSTESRLALTAQNISIGARTNLLELQSVLQAKLIAIREIKDREVAEQKLSTFRKEFGEASKRFEIAVKQHVMLLDDQLKQRQIEHDTLIENILLLAEQQVANFELNDICRHWRSRRSGYWGYMNDFQNNVANRIFPKVQQMLGEYTEFFANFSKRFEVCLTALSKEGDYISESLQIGATLPFDVTDKLRESLERSLQSAGDQISTAELQVNALLADFVTDEVSDRIDLQRKKVSDIVGVGTTKSQDAEVREFYRELKTLLLQALKQHLSDGASKFSSFLVNEATGAPRDALSEVQILLEQAADNIRAAATALVADQKEAAHNLVATIEGDFKDVLIQAEQLLQVEDFIIDETMKLGVADVFTAQKLHLYTSNTIDANNYVDSMIAGSAPALPIDPTELGAHAQSANDENWFERVQIEATSTLKRIRLADGATGWPYEKIFPEKWIKGALGIRLVDPFLAQPHQIRNLKEFLVYIAEVCKPKIIEVLTGFSPVDLMSNQNRAMDAYVKDLFKNYGISLSITRSEELHDRYLILSHGVVFKLGRGLDIYKPATGLAAYRPANRRVRETGIDVFAAPSSAMVVNN